MGMVSRNQGGGFREKGQGATLLPSAPGLRCWDELGRCCDDKATAEPSSLQCPSAAPRPKPAGGFGETQRYPRAPPFLSSSRFSGAAAASLPTGTWITRSHRSAWGPQKQVNWKPATYSDPDMEPMMACSGMGGSRRGCSQPRVLQVHMGKLRHGGVTEAEEVADSYQRNSAGLMSRNRPASQGMKT